MKTNFSKIAFWLLIIFVANGCTKAYDDNFDTSYNNKMVMINAAVDMPLARVSVTPPASGNIMLDLGNLSVSSTKPNENDLTITLRINNTLLADYNTVHSTNLIPFSANAINLPLVYKIPAGQKQVAIEAVVNPALIDLSNSYAIGLSIVSITGQDGIKINDLYKDCLFGISIKNKYDGKYKLTGNSMVDVTNPAFVGYYPLPFEFITTGPDEVLLIDQDNLGIPGHIFSTGTGLSYYGNFGMKFKFDVTTDKAIAVTNSYGQGTAAPQLRYASIDPSGINQWNPTNKNLKIKYFMHQNASVPTPPNVRVRFDENFDYVGPR